MKGVILAKGPRTRFAHLTKVGNKCFLTITFQDGEVSW